MKRQLIETIADCDRLEALIVASAQATTSDLLRLMQLHARLSALALIKFTEIGRDPLNPDRPLNLVEQLNQSFTYLASVGAARWLLARHPECAPLILNQGTTPGWDLESQCGRFVADPKLRKAALLDPEGSLAER